MKIIICGGGIAGLATFLHLRKHLPNPSTHSIKIYESHRPRSTAPLSSLDLSTLSESTATVGGGLGISPNGMRVLRELDPALHDVVAAQGFRAENFVFKGANGWALGVQRTGDGGVRGVEGGEEEVCIASSRQGVWECLMRAVEEGGGVVRYAKVVGIERDDGSGVVRVRVVDEEGRVETEEADLLVGADGVKSVVRTALFGEDEKFKPTYTGLSGVGGFLSTPLPPAITHPPSMVFTFGRNGFFGYSSSRPLSSESLMWWSTFETSSLPNTKFIDPAAIKAALVERHKHWADPVVQDIVSKAKVESIYPTWVLPELPHWGERGVVLVGDAAHAMDPTTGQGASQALEDAQTLALLLKELLSTGETSRCITGSEKQRVDVAIKLLYDIRSPRAHEIVERGKKIAGRKANVGVVEEYFMYVFLWLMNRFPVLGRIMLGDVNRQLYTWSAEEEIQKALERRKSA